MRATGDRAKQRACGAASGGKKQMRSAMTVFGIGAGEFGKKTLRARHLKRSLFIEQAVHSQEFDALPQISPEKIHEVTPVQRQPEGAGLSQSGASNSRVEMAEQCLT